MSRLGWGGPGRAAVATVLAVLLSALVAACGGSDSTSVSDATAPATTEKVVVQTGNGDFDPAAIYEKAAPAVVTVVSIFGQSSSPLGPNAGQGSGFVISDQGEIVTNAHVVTSGGTGNGGGEPKEASQVYVEFSDRNRLQAEVVGFDPDADVALIKVDPSGLDLHTLQLSDRNEYAVGEPVAAIGSPFGEEQSLSVGIISATDRSINSLTQFSVDNAIQTDASINPGNSGGPLLDGSGKVIGINQQIESSSGSNSGVGFAIPVTAIRYSVDQLRDNGSVEYAYLGVSTQGLWPQLADHLGIDADTGVLVGEVVPGGPADDAGIVGGNDQETFQGQRVKTGGDVIVALNGRKLTAGSDLSELIARSQPGDTVNLEIIHDGEHRNVDVTLAPRPGHVSNAG